MAITTLAQAIAGLQRRWDFYVANATMENVARWHSLWRTAYCGSPLLGATPPAYTAGSGYVPTNTTQGSFPLVDPVSGNTHVARMAASSSQTNQFVLIDRLWHCSGFDSTVTSAQVITTPGVIPSRDANGAALGVGVEIWVEVYTIPGSTGAAWTVEYTNQAGVTGRVATYTHPADAEFGGTLCQMTLQAGDTGVRAVASFTADISSGIAGNLGITLLRPICAVPVIATDSRQYDLVQLAMPRVYDGTCLSLMIYTGAAATGNVLGHVQVTQG